MNYSTHADIKSVITFFLKSSAEMKNCLNWQGPTVFMQDCGKQNLDI